MLDMFRGGRDRGHREIPEGLTDEERAQLVELKDQPALRQPEDEPMNEASLYFAAYAVFGSGLAVGLTNIASGCVRAENAK